MGLIRRETSFFREFFCCLLLAARLFERDVVRNKTEIFEGDTRRLFFLFRKSLEIVLELVASRVEKKKKYMHFVAAVNYFRNYMWYIN